jgi:phosphoglycolate phosphatase
MAVAGADFRLLIFDWDGTLSDSAAMIVNAMQAAIRGLGLPPRSDAAIRELIGLGLNEGLERLYPDTDIPDLRRLLDSYRARWLSEGGGEAPLFAGALEAVGQLHGQGYRIAIATGKSRAGLNRSLAHHAALRAYVHASRTADETASKPNPLMLGELLAETGLGPAEALMIGDTDFDLDMARSIGMPAVGVTCGVHAPERLRAAGAAALLDAVADLPGWLQRRRGALSPTPETQGS